MLDPTDQEPARIDAQQPILSIVVDTEEEFDWARPLDRANTSVDNIRHQARAHRVFERYGVVPTYVVDYPVASQPDGVGPLKELLDGGACEIGAHLHPWVNPPDSEEVCNRNSYPGNLPPELEREKLRVLAAAIGDSFGVEARVYKAGRYGVGPATAGILDDLGFDLDCSVVPLTDFSAAEGPDFTAYPDQPYWFGPGRRMLEVPLTVGFAGTIASQGRWLYPAISGPTAMKARVPGVFARSGLLERIRLTPEGATFEELRRLTRAALGRGQTVFSLAYHSSSLAPGNTPYVTNARELDRFLGVLDAYIEFFFGEVGGRAHTPSQILALARGGTADDTG